MELFCHVINKSKEKTPPTQGALLQHSKPEMAKHQRSTAEVGARVGMKKKISWNPVWTTLLIAIKA